MFNKILIDRHPVFIRADIYPTFFCLFYNPVSLLKKENICRYFRSRTCFESGVWQAYCAEKFCSVCYVLSYGRICPVHCTFGRDCRNDAARTNLIQRFRKKVVMNVKAEAVVFLIIYFERTKRHIGYYRIERIVCKVRFFKSLNLYFCLRIQKFCNAACQRVYLYAVGFFRIECFGQ